MREKFGLTGPGIRTRTSVIRYIKFRIRIPLVTSRPRGKFILISFIPPIANDNSYVQISNILELSMMQDQCHNEFTETNFINRYAVTWSHIHKRCTLAREIR